MSSAEIARAARAVRGAASALTSDGQRLGEGHAQLTSTTRELAAAWRSPRVQHVAQTAEHHLERVAPAPDILQATSSSLEALGGSGESIAARLRGHEDRLGSLQQQRRMLLNDPDPTTSAGLAHVEAQLSQVRNAMERETANWDAACSDTARLLASRADELRAVARDPRLSDSYLLRSLLSAPTILRGAEVFHGAGVLATNWVRHTRARAARFAAGWRASSGQLVRAAAGVAAGTWRVRHGGRFVRAAGSALNLGTAPFRATAAARDASRAARAKYTPRLTHLQSRMGDGRHLMRHGTVVSRVTGNVARVAAVPQDYRVLRQGSSYEGNRGTVDRTMAGVGLTSAAAAAGGLALKGVAAVGIGAGLVVAAPVLAKVALVGGTAAAVWGLGNLAWDASSDLRQRTSKKVSAVASSAKAKASEVGSAVADGASKAIDGATSVIASAGGGLKRLGSVFGGG